MLGGWDIQAWPPHEMWGCAEGEFSAEKKGCTCLLLLSGKETGGLHTKLQKALLLLAVFFQLNKLLVLFCVFQWRIFIKRVLNSK